VIALLGGLLAWQVRAVVVFAFIGFHALMALSLELGLFPAICSVAWLVFLPAPFWDWAEKRLRTVRARVGISLKSHFQADAQPRPALGARRRPLAAAIGNTFAVFFLIYVFLWNLRTADHRRFDKYLPKSMEWIGWISGTAQVWDMFSPGPLMEGGWFVMPAQLANGKEVDIFRHGAGVSWEKPALVSRMYKNDRWRKYLVLIAAASNTDLRPPLGGYLRRQWNTTHSNAERIASLQIILMEQDTLPERGYTAPRPILLWSGK
jgi:hypothetical protein